jgi:hypothetical protein
MTLYPLYRSLRGAHGRSGRGRKISPTPGFDPRTVQPIASCYKQYATPTDCGEEDIPLSLQGTKHTSTWSPITTSNTLSRLQQFLLLFWHYEQHIHQGMLVEWHNHSCGLRSVGLFGLSSTEGWHCSDASVMFPKRVVALGRYWSDRGRVRHGRSWVLMATKFVEF